MTEDEKREKALAEVNKFKNSVVAHALASSTEELLGEILAELQIMNLHLASISNDTSAIDVNTFRIEMNTDSIKSNTSMIEINTSGL